MRFRDREHAGRELVGLLGAYAGRGDVVVLGVARGGVAVAVEVARGLGVGMAPFLVRKLGVPGREELAMGAIANGVVVLNEEIAGRVNQADLDRVIRAETEELERRRVAYGAKPVDVTGRTVILVDDGLATGASARAAVEALRKQNPARIVLAVPTAPRETVEEFQALVDEVVCAYTPESFAAVGQAYRDFAQVSDREVRRLLR
ncbi:phosphoribosyltransferase family protein [Actinocrispum sp. NPDC049592]|uniref:phosphoribosyltransferase n=1 Tax=Actinocrispum sp. NPDC049592 TaxID=3154835 RepID=UPI0034443386